MACGNKGIGCLLGWGAFSVVTGGMLAIFWPTIFFGQLQRMMILTPSSMSFDVWRETPIPMYLEFFMWNITNVDEMLAGDGDIIPELVQMGPYVFKETHSKENITWNDNATVTFFNQRYWYYEPERSNGSLSDELTSINAVVATVAYMVRHRGPAITIPVNTFMRAVHEHMFITANVSTWLFDGIQDPILDIAQHLPIVNLLIPYDRFGWFYDRNGSMTYDGRFLMNTGAEDFSRLGNVEKWRYSNRTVYRDECGVVRGSTGELWAPELGQEEAVIFVPDICTFISLAKTRDNKVMGIDGVMYSSNQSLFDNGHNYPGTACYCDEDHPSECMPSGALNVSLCRYGAPAFASLPHFYGADPIYLTQTHGLEPKEEHKFRLTLEMFTGMPLAVAAQLQVSVLVRRVQHINILNSIPDNTMMPMFWFRQELEVTPEFADMAKFALNLRYGMMYGLYVLTALGIALLLGGIVFLVRRILISPETTPILNDYNQETE